MNQGLCYKCFSCMLIVLGVVFILVRAYRPLWDMWVVIGMILIAKGLFHLAKPTCNCEDKEMKTSIKKRK